jgi:hypothetical protein
MTCSPPASMRGTSVGSVDLGVDGYGDWKGAVGLEG